MYIIIYKMGNAQQQPSKHDLLLPFSKHLPSALLGGSAAVLPGALSVLLAFLRGGALASPEAFWRLLDS